MGLGKPTGLTCHQLYRVKSLLLPFLSPLLPASLPPFLSLHPSSPHSLHFTSLAPSISLPSLSPFHFPHSLHFTSLHFTSLTPSISLPRQKVHGPKHLDIILRCLIPCKAKYMQYFAYPKLCQMNFSICTSAQSNISFMCTVKHIFYVHSQTYLLCAQSNISFMYGRK